MQRRIFWCEFVLLWGTAVSGSMLGLFLTHLPAEALATQLYIPLQAQSYIAISIALTAQIGLQLAIATGIGLWAAGQVGVGAPVLEAWLQHKPLRRLLRSLLLPVIATALLVSVFSNLPVLSVLNPDRKQRAAEFEAFSQTPQVRQLQEQIERLAPARPMTRLSQAVIYANSALSGEIFDALFMLSVFALLLRTIRRTRVSEPDSKLFWAAIVAVAAIRAIDTLWGQSIGTQIDRNLDALMGLHMTRDPFSLVALRGLIRIVPSKIAQGWLYTRYGIEAAILASFVGASLSYLMLIHVFVRFA